jgi:hypothetical protein
MQYSDDMVNKLTDGCNSINSHFSLHMPKKEEISVSIYCLLQERDFVLAKNQN